MPRTPRSREFKMRRHVFPLIKYLLKILCFHSRVETPPVTLRLRPRARRYLLRFVTSAMLDRLLGSRLFGHLPAGKYQNGGVTLKDTRQGLGSLDAQIDGICFNG